MKEEGKVFLVFVKTRKYKDKISYLFYRVSQEQVDGKPLDETNEPSVAFSRSGLTKVVSGTVYEFSAKLDGGELQSISPSTRRWVCQWHNEEQRTRWQAEHRAEQATMEMLRQERKAGKNTDFDKLCKRLNTIYHNMPAVQREGFLAAVLSRIMKRP